MEPLLVTMYFFGIGMPLGRHLTLSSDRNEVVIRDFHRLGLLLLLPALLGGCYYQHLAVGQLALLQAREPITRVVGAPDTDPELKARLLRVQAARRWAVGALALPDNGSYTDYAALDRPYVVWNVFATPPDSLEPVEACFLVVGCLAYQGFYTREKAEARADRLRERGLDVYVGGVPAYSTLGWFDDPVISTMLRWDDGHLIGTVFHELAHQMLYVRDDTPFNESYAQFVEQEGLRHYLAEHPLDYDAAAQGRRAQFVKLVLAAREKLQELYDQPLTLDAKLRGKAVVLEQLRADYRALRDAQWKGYAGYDAWFADPGLNNAKLLPFGLYDAWVPAFAALFEQQGRDWPRFHAAVKRLSTLPSRERQETIERLMP
jgi:predicted aminopeptidase